MAEIVALVKKAGAESVAQYEEPDRYTVQFRMAGRLVRFRVAMPTADDVGGMRGVRPATDRERAATAAQRCKQRARALLLVIKAKLESVASEVETFEEAFLPNVVMANGQTVYDRIAAPIALEYQSGSVNPMLLTGPPQ